MQATGVMERSPSVSESEFPVEVSRQYYSEKIKIFLLIFIGLHTVIIIVMLPFIYKLFYSRKEPKRFRSFSSCEYRKGVKVWDL